MPNIDLHVFMATLELAGNSDGVLDKGFCSLQFRDRPHTEQLMRIRSPRRKSSVLICRENRRKSWQIGVKIL